MTGSRIIPIAAVLFCLHSGARATDDIPLLRPEERAAVDAQTDAFNTALKPALATAAQSTVRVWSGKRRLAYGTVIGAGDRILTTWSEVASAAAPVRVEGAGGVVLPARMVGVYQDDDLALLETSGGKFTPVRWSSDAPALGAFLAASQPDGRPAAFGVVSVPERNLRETDSAFLGVSGALGHDGNGVKIEEVTPESGAAAAGLKPGDVILSVGDRRISGVMELKNSLVGIEPGSRVNLRVQSGGAEKQVEVLLGNRPALPQFSGDRLRRMERMGGQISRVGDSFSRAIQTDMRPRPDQIGGPVADLNGRVIGITLARAGRTRAYVMPAGAVQKLLQSEPLDPALAQARQAEAKREVTLQRMPAPGAPRLRPGGEQRLRQHLEEMQQLMDFMLDEMNALEEGR